MKYPNVNEEKKLWDLGYQCVVGLDEVGRGPLAGPVVVAAVMIRRLKILNLKFKIKDSKKLSELQREKIYKTLIKNPDIKWGIGIVSEKVIDKINILEATKLAMQKALRQAQGKLKKKADFLILDGNFGIDSKIPQKSIIKGDEKVFSCAAASIIAKVTRDRIMKKMHKKYPKYGFDSHKGYGTKLHIENLQNFGPCAIHRLTFAKVLPNQNLSDKIGII